MLMNLIKKNSYLLLIAVFASPAVFAQGLGAKAAFNTSSNEETKAPVEYTIGGVAIKGVRYLDEELLLAVAGLEVGSKIKLNNDELISKAIRNLWKQDLFADVKIKVSKVINDKAFLEIQLEERPRLSRYIIKGVKKGETQEIKDKINLVKAKVVTESIKKEVATKIKKYYADKGFSNTSVQIKERTDTTIVNNVVLTITIDKGIKSQINQINFAGNEHASDERLKRTFKGTKEMPRLTLYPKYDQGLFDEETRSFKKYIQQKGFLSVSKTLDALSPYMRLNVFTSSRFNASKYETDKEALINYYNTLGYRDAKILTDTIRRMSNGKLNVDVKIDEGNRYYFGDFVWKGNTKYSADILSKVLGIQKGDVYNQELLDKRIGTQVSPDGGEDISSIYMDDGYLFFNIDPQESSINNDTINYEMRVVEGPQATIKNITIVGNDRTNEYVLRRELRTLPGNKFSRSDLIRTQREIANLGFFDQEKIGIKPTPNPSDGTVDIEYSVVEKSSDQLQLSAGFGGSVRFYGNVGIAFNNFSIKNIFKPKFWDPLPVGDGQRLSVNYQSNGAFFNSLNCSFTEPWLGGKKPISLTTSLIGSRLSSVGLGGDANSSYLKVIGGGVSISKRVKWPDDNFVLSVGLNYQNFFLKNYQLLSGFVDGYANSLYFKTVLSRYSIDQPLYPRSGSDISLSFQFTPPWSLLSGKDFTNASVSEKYQWIEYFKFRFKADWYQKIIGNLVLKVSAKMGFLGYYNSTIGYAPFERFQLGGDGMQGFQAFVGRDIISQRGYEMYAQNKTIFNKYTAELRYPLSLSPTSTIYALAFFDQANAWDDFKSYNPIRLNRDAGLGIRIFLPMFGLLGLDYGVGFDRYNKDAGITSFKDMSKFTFMLGFEPD